MEQDFAKRLQSTEMTRGAYAVLSAIHHDKKATPAELANYLGVDGAAVTRHLDRIEKKGLIQRNHSTKDRRSIHVGLTEEGIRVVRQGRADSQATNEKFTAGLTAAEVDHLQSTIRAMLANVEQTVSDI